MDPWKISLVSGGLAGTAVDTLFFPIDTLKTRLQSSEGFFKAGGFKGVYRGLSSAVIGSAPGASLFFVTYDTLKTKLNGKSPDGVVHMASASIGEIAACLVRVPTEVVKQRSQTGAKGTSVSSVVVSLFRSEGLSGFYRGFTTTVSREIPFTCIQFPLYEKMKKVLAESQGLPAAPAHQAAVCGSLAGGFAAGITTPLDVCKTRIMLDKANKYPRFFPHTMKIIYNQEGLGVLFSGVTPRVLWISMGGAVFLGVFEAAKSALSSATAVDTKRD